MPVKIAAAPVVGSVILRQQIVEIYLRLRERQYCGQGHCGDAAIGAAAESRDPCGQRVSSPRSPEERARPRR